jgi:acyl-CoA reductase-like NAD-dependent aldehyde dehydrogenase
MLPLTNPTTGEPLPSPEYQSETAVNALLTNATNAAQGWGAASIAERAAVLKAIAALLRQSKKSLANTITLEMGKPLQEATGEVEKSAWNCEYVADHAHEWLADQAVPLDKMSAFVAHRPLGVILAILPWNFPVWQIFRCAASALMAGNAVVLKHAPNVPQSAANVTRLLEQAGLPRGVFQNLVVPVERIAAIIADTRIAAVTFTGSPVAGAAVASRAGAACKKSILELGGSDPFLVLEDADLEAAVGAAVRGRFTNCGQVCLAAKRFIVVESVWKEFNARFVVATEALRVGNPLELATQIGPMARSDLRDQLNHQVHRSVSKGARVLAGGQALAGRGNFFAPSVLTDVDLSMPVASEETFGPVAPLIRARSAEHAVQLANDSRYGLAAIVYSRDLDRARAIAARLQVGSVFINAVTASDPRLPVGGVKLSGYGRELGAAGIRELVNIQCVVVGG